MRRLLILASAMVFFDVAFFAAIAPLLPDYVDELGLEQGARPGSSPPPTRPARCSPRCRPGFVASRVGPRRTVIAGLLLLGVSSLVFGFAEQIVAARRRPLRPGRRRRADLVRRAHLADHRRARGAARLGDRHRARHRGRRRAARPAARRARRPRSAPSSVFGAVARDRGRARARSPARTAGGRRAASARRCARSLATMLSRPILIGDRASSPSPR